MTDLAYLGMNLIMLPLWLIIFATRKDQRHAMLKIGVVSGFLSIIADYFWYLTDYWHPNTILNIPGISLEAYLFGFFITGISISSYNFLFHKKGVKHFDLKKKETLSIFIFGLVFLIFFTNFVGINSVIVSTLGFLICAAIICFSRRDLIFPSLISGLLMIVMLLFMYTILFALIFTDFWDKYWYLANSSIDKRIIGIPVTEYLWFFSIGALMGGIYDYFKGFQKVNIKS